MGKAANGLAIEGLNHLVVAVRRLEPARHFYEDMLGLEAVDGMQWPGETGRHAVLKAADAGHLVLAEAENLPDLTETGVHQCYSLTNSRRDAAAARLVAEGFELHRYKEDNPEEATDPLYVFDPDGNRVQLRASNTGGENSPPGLDHAAIQVANLISAQWFYTEVLGLPIIHRVGWRTADYIRAQAWAKGEEDMAPGTRRRDKRYTVMVSKKVVARVNMQMFLACGTSTLAVYLANQHFQESPEEQTVGVPRIGYRLSPAAMADAATRLAAADWPYSGPQTYSPGLPITASLFFRDPGGNFIELTTS